MAIRINLTPKERNLAIAVAVIFALTVVAPNFALQYTNQYIGEQRSLKRTLEGEIAQLQDRLAGIEDERQAVRANRADYLRWVEAGAVGDQKLRAVSWVKSMKRIVTNRKLFPLSVDFDDEPTLLAAADSPFTTGSSVQVRFWNMSMSMPMLHDLDVLMFFEAMDQRVDSMFFPVECSFNLLHQEFLLERRENMSSDCRLVWVSAHDPETKVAI